jgi:hypothetical protein
MDLASPPGVLRISIPGLSPSPRVGGRKDARLFRMSFDAGSLFTSVVVSGIGFAIFHYGRKQHRFPQLIAGAILMIYPYFVGGVLMMTLVGVAILGLLVLAVRSGW